MVLTAIADPEGEGMQQPDDHGPSEPKAAASTGGEHRDVHRKRTLKAARIVLTDRTVMDCTIRDLSEGGAHLVLGDAVKLPEAFRLLIVSSKMLIPARLQWQRGMDAGVAFTGPGEAMTRSF